MYDKHITGFTTYKCELLRCLKKTDNVTPYIISLRCPTVDFEVKIEEDIVSYSCPGKHNDVMEISCALLALYIENRKDNIFMFNFSPTAQWVKVFRKYFSNGKMVYIIHDFMWSLFLLGDVNELCRIIKRNPNDKQSIFINKIFKDGKETFFLSDKVVCLSDDTYNLLQKVYGISVTKLVKINNGLHDYSCRSILYKDQYKKILKKKGRHKILLYVGRISLQKGAYDLINSFPIVLKQYPNAILVMAGDFESDLLQNINDDIRENLILLGGISHERLCQWYQIADWGVIPSYYEQCSYTGIEMKMFGLPIISSNGIGVRNMFNSQNSIIAHIGKINTCEYQHNLSEAIIKALSLSKSQVERFRFLSKEDYKIRYGISNMFKEYSNIFSELS